MENRTYVYVKATAPTTGDDTNDGYFVGDRWINTDTDKEYVCLDVTAGAAVWTETTYDGGTVEDIIADGWYPAGATWTYASATSFTVAGDYSGILVQGVKIKLTQTTVKKFSVTSSDYSSPNTTVNITAGDDYTLVNAAITEPYYSLFEAPEGFPETFSWTPTFTGFSADPTGTHKFRILPHGMYVDVQHSSNGTSNANTFYFTPPPGIQLPDNATLGLLYLAIDNNSIVVTSPGKVLSAVTATNLYRIWKDYAQTGDTHWTTSNGKRCRFSIVHPIA